MRKFSIISIGIVFVLSGKLFSQVSTDIKSPGDRKTSHQVDLSTLSLKSKPTSPIKQDSVNTINKLTKDIIDTKGNLHLGLDLNKLSDSIKEKLHVNKFIDSIQRKLPLDINSKNQNEKVSVKKIADHLSKVLVSPTATGHNSNDNHSLQNLHSVGVMTRTLKYPNLSKINIPNDFLKDQRPGKRIAENSARSSFYTNSYNALERNGIDTNLRLISISDSAYQKTKFIARPIKMDTGGQQNIPPDSPLSDMDYSGRNSVTTAWHSPVTFISPTASTLLGAINENVDLYTGKLNVNIPIYNLKSYEIEVPVNLNYNSSGVKVDDIAGSTGMGWNLQAGGCIARVMHNLPDEFLGDVVVYSPIDKGPYNIPAFGYLGTKTHVDLSNYPSGYNATTQKGIIRRSAWYAYDWASDDGLWDDAEAWDTQPDEFYFHFGKYSGKFVFDQDGNINCIPFRNFKIDKTIIIVQEGSTSIPKIVQFSIRTEDGYTYYFGDENLTSVEETQFEETRMTTNYEYNHWGWLYCSDRYLNVYYPPSIHLGVRGDGLIYPDTHWAPGNSSLSTYEYFTSCWYLKEIISPSGDNVLFSYNNNGTISYIQSKSQDIRFPNLIARLNTNDSHYYFLSPAYPYPHYGMPMLNELQSFTYSVGEVNLKSKKLASITASNGEQVNFHFNTSREDLVGDKRLDEIAINHNGTPIKYFDLGYTYQTSPNYFDVFNLDLYGFSPDLLYLNGDTSFMDIKYALSNPPNQAEFIQHYLDIINSEFKRLLLTSLQERSVQGNVIPPYEFEYDQEHILPRRFHYAADKWGYMNNNEVGTRMPFVNYNDLGQQDFPNNPCVIPPIGWDNYSAPSPSYLGATQGTNLTLGSTLSLIKVKYPTGGGSIIVYEQNTSGSESVGGLRVKELKRYPDFSNTSDIVVKSYNYSVGIEPCESIFGYALGSCTNDPLSSSCVDPPTQYFLRDVFYSSHPVNSVFETRGGIVGYHNVNENISGAGTIRTEFYSPSVIPNSFSHIYEVYPVQDLINVYPFPPDLNREWKCGLADLVRITQTDNNKIVKKYENTYDTLPSFFTRKYSWGLIPAIAFLTDYINTEYADDPMEREVGGIYKFESGYLYKQQQIETNYNSGYPGDDSKSVKKTTNYEFNKTDIAILNSNDTYPHTYLKSCSEIGSQGITKKEYFKYSFDYPLNTGTSDWTSLGINIMQYCGILNTPIEKFTTDNQTGSESVTSGEIRTVMLLNPTLAEKIWQIGVLNPILYANFQQSTIINPGFQMDPSYNLRIKYDVYDTHSNLLQYHKTDDMNKSYYWGYNGSLPVIEADNVDQITLTNAMNFLFTDFEGFLDALGDLTDVNDRIALNSFNTFLRNELPSDARVYTYTYLPMIGMTSKTDQNDITTYYYYDEFNRLKTEKDSKDNILHTYYYHYAGQ